jgi:hypothetical protein
VQARKHPAKMSFTEDHEVNEAFPAYAFEIAL